MKENTTYGECLSEILMALNLNSSRLAREINIDSSLIYKWLRNERIPSYDSPYIDLILNYISRKTMNPSQRKALTEFLAKFEIEMSDTSDTHILNNLKLLLQNSQGYSIKLRNKIKNEHKLNSSRISSITGFIKNIDSQSNSYDNNSYDKTNLQHFDKNENLFCDCDNVQIAKGNLEVLSAAINLLEQAPETPPPNDNTILLTFNSDLRLLFSAREINSVWIKALYKLLSNGWKLILHIALDNNIGRTVKIIEDIQLLLTIGNLTIYYYHRQPNDPAMDTELFVIPQTGALIGFSAYIKNQIDSAFIFHSKNSTELLSARFFLNLNSAKPLLKSYPSQKLSEFQQAFADSEETPGEKNVFKGGLSTITIPLNLYEKYLSHTGITNQELSYRSFLHKRRLDAFEEQVVHYKFRDICYIESVVDLVDKKMYSFDEKYLLQDYMPQNADIICHLENLISLLEKYDNYNIAFVNKSYFEHMNSISWMAKGNNCVLIETFNNNCMDYFNSKMNFLITEKSVVTAFQDYFNILWKYIPDVNKDKRNTILWLRSLIEKCRLNLT